VNKELLVRGYRWAFGLADLAAIATGFYDRVLHGDAGAVNYFSYFTILSNIFAVAIFLAWMRPSGTYDLLRGAVVVYMAVTGVVYGLLLAHYPVSVAAWINDMEHRVMPVVVVADWLIAPPSRRVPWRRVMIWLVFPVAYLIYTEIRGPIAQWYPYPFLDPRIGGYGRVAAYSAGIAVAFVLFSWAVAALGSLRAHRTPAPG